MNVTLRKIFFTLAGTRYRLEIETSNGRTVKQDYCFYHYAQTSFDVWMRLKHNVAIVDRATGEVLCSARFSIGFK